MVRFQQILGEFRTRFWDISKVVIRWLENQLYLSWLETNRARSDEMPLRCQFESTVEVRGAGIEVSQVFHDVDRSGTSDGGGKPGAGTSVGTPGLPGTGPTATVTWVAAPCLSNSAADTKTDAAEKIKKAEP